MCASIDLRFKRLCFFDSMGSKQKDVLDNLARWVADEAKASAVPLSFSL